MKKLTFTEEEFAIAINMAHELNNIVILMDVAPDTELQARLVWDAFVRIKNLSFEK